MSCVPMLSIAAKKSAGGNDWWESASLLMSNSKVPEGVLEAVAFLRGWTSFSLRELPDEVDFDFADVELCSV